MARRLILILQVAAVMLMTSPAPAVVYLNCADLGNGVVELSYDANEEAVPVRAFALDITVSSGVITAVGNFSPDYWVYPSTLIIDEWGEPVDFGTPVWPPGYWPDTLGGLGTSGMTISMGSLYPPEANAPPPTGVLLTFIISAECDVTVEENALRGGVVLEDATSATISAPVLEGALPPEPGVYGGGAGTAEDPFLIFSAEQLDSIALNPGDLYRHFKLMADIDLGAYTGTDFNTIGSRFGFAFGGVFDGNNHSISNFTYSCTDSNYVGLFGFVDGIDAQIRDLDLVDPNVNAGSSDDVGSLVGYFRRGTISRCSAQGGTVTGRNCVGGLVGRNYLGTIADCYASTNVVGDANLGGLVGRTYVEVSNCYSTGSVLQSADVTGGLVGFNHGEVASSFWDEQTSGQESGAGGTGDTAVTDVNGKTTEQMQTRGTFTSAGWDFKGESDNGTQDTWTICEGQTYPALVRRRFLGDFIGLDGVDMADFSVLALAWRCTDSDPNWYSFCDISDPNDGVIDERDLAVFADNWLVHSR
jgi:hypothetical protein